MLLPVWQVRAMVVASFTLSAQTVNDWRAAWSVSEANSHLHVKGLPGSFVQPTNAAPRKPQSALTAAMRALLAVDRARRVRLAP